MLAVVQIGSKTLRSACSTARTVCALLGVVCALRRLGADMAAALATVPLTNIRRDVAIGVSSSPLLTRKSGIARYFLGYIDLGMVCRMRQAQSKQCIDCEGEKIPPIRNGNRTELIALRGGTHDMTWFLGS